MAGETAPSVVCPFHMQGKCFQEKAFLGHVLTPSPVFTKSKKDPLGTKRYATYLAIRGFPELSYSAVNTCHVSQTPAVRRAVLFCLISLSPPLNPKHNTTLLPSCMLCGLRVLYSTSSFFTSISLV